MAIVMVVAFHAHVSGFSGGFVGVHVFFMISGWLIDEVERSLMEVPGRR